MSSRLIAVLAGCGAVVVGVVVGLLLVAPSGSGPAASSTAPAPPGPSSSRPVPVDPDVAAVEVVGKAIAAAIVNHDATAFGKLTCVQQSSASLAELKRKWEAAGKVSATVPDPPSVGGDSATVTVHVEGAGGQKDTPFPLKKRDGKWCVP
ncbi:hypothetical protein [Amycolatopsis regifaucium]|uniref:DUF4878 domain-containing protein n=1 Tax=Amycolatopsis regifaucium TaxID=546365 RepID=A0A154MXC3_9PSEU|nr:hypothetical protein [Amycolatopsis regifaucium]KZB88109.1 hypothetical protein AVL48_19255 [Amycolatopsis regifaucium]OKA04388.1 hypothetical protein ATP06_0231255 [Amycolatopsis regifaucium]SFH48032.1 hypothetical protein SAMN04489731_104392 [Amycolatopsis regifaucium]